MIKSLGSVIGIRSNKWSAREEALYEKLLRAFPASSVYLIADETKGKVEVPDDVQKIAWDHAFLQEQGLLDYRHFDRGIGWLCGDYFFYAFEQGVKADFYWLVDSDIDFYFPNPRQFFDPTHQLQTDGLLARFRQIDEHDYWYRSTLLAGGPEQAAYTCLFSLIRLSRQAILACKQARQALSQYYAEQQAFSFDNNPIGIHFPNDESLVTPTLLKQNFSIQSLNDLYPSFFEFFSPDRWVAKNSLSALSHQVAHPVRSLPEIVNRIVQGLVKDIQKNQAWAYHIVNEENAGLVAQAVTHQLSHHIEYFLKKHFQNCTIMNSLKDLVYAVAHRYNYEYNVSVWDENTVVLDIFLADENLVLDLRVEDNILYIKTFQRFSDDAWAASFEPYFPMMSLEGNVAFLHRQKLQNKDHMLILSQDAVETFFRILERYRIQKGIHDPLPPPTRH